MGSDRRGPARLGLVFALWATMAGTTLPNALWGWYYEHWGVSPTTVSAAFATYATAVVLSLPAGGSIAGRHGPWRSLRLGVALSAAASAVSLLNDVPALFAGRALAGLSVGLVSGAAVAALTDPRRGGADGAAHLSTFATMVGLATGPLLAGAAVEATAGSVDGAYVAHLVVAAAALVWLGRRVGAPAARPGGVVRPQRVRRDRTFVAAALAGFAANAQLGLYAVLAPAMLADVLGHGGGVLLSGLAGCLLFTAAGTAQLTTGGLTSSARLTAAVANLAVATVAVAAGLSAPSIALVVLAILLGGLGAGLAFGEGLHVAVGTAGPDRRAAVSSSWFVVAYLGLVGPVLGAGALADSAGILAAATVLSTVATALVLLSTVAIARTSSHRHTSNRKEKLWSSS